jgi:Phosphopantetheine attachment site/AMP-binding enzyme C-terminal domain
VREIFAAEQSILPHRRYPMVDLRKEMRNDKLFHTTFNYVHFHVYRGLGGEGRSPISKRGGYARTSLDFFVNFWVAPESGEIRGTVHCDTAVMSRAALERVAGYYERVLEGMKEERMGDLRTEEERKQMERWSWRYAENAAAAGQMQELLYGVAMEEGGEDGLPKAGSRRVQILNEANEAVPAGVVGEICISGAGEGVNRRGVLGRWREDGEIEVVGKKELEVEVGGYRIELWEIERLLREQEGVKEAAVAVKEGVESERELVAYYTVEGEPGGGELEGRVEGEQLQGYLAGRLPGYMVPRAYVRMESMPLGEDGEVDRKRLPAAGAESYAVSRYEAPEGETEAGLAGIWAEVLQVERVGRHDNFFELGGRSLLAVQVIVRVRQSMGIEVGVNDLFARPVLRDFAESIIDRQLEGFDLAELTIALRQIQES